MNIACYPFAKTSQRAKFCLPYMMAIALLDRKAGIKQFSDERVVQKDVQKLMKKVEVSVPKDLEHHRGKWGTGGVNWGEMRLAVHLKDGQVLRTNRSHAKGWSEDPVTWEDLEGKYSECASAVQSASQIDDTIAMIRKLEQLPDVRELMAILQIN
jgi:2-methylcitrate dehydratase PrpD